MGRIRNNKGIKIHNNANTECSSVDSFTSKVNGLPTRRLPVWSPLPSARFKSLDECGGLGQEGQAVLKPVPNLGKQRRYLCQNHMQNKVMRCEPGQPSRLLSLLYFLNRKQRKEYWKPWNWWEPSRKNNSLLFLLFIIYYHHYCHHNYYHSISKKYHSFEKKTKSCSGNADTNIFFFSFLNHKIASRLFIWMKLWFPGSKINCAIVIVPHSMPLWQMIISSERMLSLNSIYLH